MCAHTHIQTHTHTYTHTHTHTHTHTYIEVEVNNLTSKGVNIRYKITQRSQRGKKKNRVLNQRNVGILGTKPPQLVRGLMFIEGRAE